MASFTLGLITARADVTLWVALLRGLADDVVYVDIAVLPCRFPMVGAWIVPLRDVFPGTLTWFRRLSSRVLLICNHLVVAKALAQYVPQPLVIIRQNSDLSRGIATLCAMQSGQLILPPIPARAPPLTWK